MTLEDYLHRFKEQLFCDGINKANREGKIEGKYKPRRFQTQSDKDPIPPFIIDAKGNAIENPLWEASEYEEIPVYVHGVRAKKPEPLTP